MKHREMRFEVIEDNGGGLHLFVFGEDGKAVYCHSDYEYHDGQLLEDIQKLKDGADPVAEGWDGNCGGVDWEYGEDHQGIYDQMTSYEYGWDVVADNEEIYPVKMGAAAKREFGQKWKDGCRYYSTQRPVAPGTYPRPKGNEILEITNFDERTFCPEIGREAWGYIVYKDALEDRLAESYELRAFEE